MKLLHAVNYYVRDSPLKDIDIDLCPSKLPKIFEKIREERGELGLLQVCTFGTESTKSAILTACFKEGTKVLTSNGEKRIEDIRAGDLVATEYGFEPVIIPTILPDKKPNYFIKTKNSVNVGFYCTEDHEILTIPFYRRMKGKNITDKMKIIFPELQNLSSLDNTYDLFARNFREVEPTWKQAKDLSSHDYGLIPVDSYIDNSIINIKW